MGNTCQAWQTDSLAFHMSHPVGEEEEEQQPLILKDQNSNSFRGDEEERLRGNLIDQTHQSRPVSHSFLVSCQLLRLWLSST